MINTSDFIGNHLARRISNLKYLKETLKRSLEEAPGGRLVISHTRRSPQYFHKTESRQNKGLYIEKNNHKLVSSLAQKDYDQKLLLEVEAQEAQYNKMLALLPQSELTAVYDQLSDARKDLVIPRVLNDEQFVEQWLAVEYSGLTFSNELSNQQTERGEKVRSKSEKIIADKLWSMGIPYRYEYPVYLEGFGTVHPDFTLLKVSTREEFYLEHFGMMDNPDYVHKALLKLRSYSANGIYPGKNLILTFETHAIPFDICQLEPLLKDFLR